MADLDDFGALSSELILSSGLQVRRATTILFAIESRTAYLIQQSVQATATYLTQQTVEEQEQAFFNAVANSRDLPIQPSIFDIDRFAPQWRDLVPANDSIKAAITGLLAEKYRFTKETTPRLSEALDWDSASVQEAYQAQRNQPFESIYAPSLPLREQLRWQWSRISRRLEELSPFWTAYALTVTGTVGASVLALPIVVAEVGVFAGVILIIVLGLVNMLTIAALSEAIIRTGSMRYGNTYLGKLIQDNLGNASSAIFAIVLFAHHVLLLIAYYSGFSQTFADITGISPVVWAGLLFLVVLYFLRKESLNATVASALIIGLVNIAILIVLSLIAFSFFNLDYITGGSLSGGVTFEPNVLQLIFGVIVAAFFGHTSAANASKIVLTRDSSGKSLLWGNVAATGTALVIYSIWVVAINGAIAPDALVNIQGTAITPLGERVGPIVYIIGSVYVVLAMGMAAINYSLGTFFTVREFLPAEARAEKQNPRTKQRRFLISFSPVFLIFLLTIWMLSSNQESFVSVIGFVGVLVVPLLAGIFPVLILATSQRIGEFVPGISSSGIWRILRVRAVLIFLYALFFLGILLHGLIIWTDPIKQGIAIFTSIIIAALTFDIFRRGTFAPRAIIELRTEKGMHQHTLLTVTSAGETQNVDVQLKYADNHQLAPAQSAEIHSVDALQAIHIQLPPLNVNTLKIWLHSVDKGISVPIPAEVIMRANGQEQSFTLPANKDQVTIPHDGKACKVIIQLATPF